MQTFLIILRSSFLYVFHPNPGQAAYGSAAMVALIAACLALLVLSLAIRSWRAGARNPVTRRLSKSWSMASFWFGAAGLVLAVSRVEQIQFMAMRFLLILWACGLLLFAFFQARKFRSRHYEVLPSQRYDDPRDRYIPGRKK